MFKRDQNLQIYNKEIKYNQSLKGYPKIWLIGWIM